MPDNDNELKNKVDRLEKEVEDLKKQLEETIKELKENSKRDKKHHEELKRISESHHKENLTWNKCGAILTPLVVAVVPFVVKYLDRKKTITSQSIQPIKKDAENMSDKMDKILKAIEKNK
jgi:hypothetical protein